MPTANTAIATLPARASGDAVAGPMHGLIVHDDLDLRLKVADLLRKAGARRHFDSATRGAFQALPAEQLRRYSALFFVLEFNDHTAASDALLAISRVHDQMPRLPVFVIARGGDERSAVRSLKSGATDYWPIHSISLTELGGAMRLLEAADGISNGTQSAALKPIAELPGYRLVKVLTESNSRAVYLAEHCDSPELVALKTQRIADVSSSEVKRFLRECELLAALNNRAIANVIDFGATPQFCYLAMEYFPCGSLRDRLRNPLTEAEALNYAVQICEALRIVHAADVVHRDLKPSNLMLTHDNRLVMIDFGLARSRAAALEITHPDLSLGSPYYVAPEQIAGQEPDVRSDLYSFGIVMYEMLTGAVPFRSNNLADIMQAHRSAPVPRLAASRQQYQILLDRLLAKDPVNRFASAPEVQSALRSLIENSAIRSNQ